MVVVVGGHSRNVGKTSVVAGLIAATPEMEWTALKITQYGHGICSDHGEECGCADPLHPFVISEELERRSGTDTSRFMVSGAQKVFWARTAMGQLGEAWPELQAIFSAATNVICESNSILQFVHPDVCVMVLDGGVADFKPSSLRYLDRADVLVARDGTAAQWTGVSNRLMQGKRVVSFSPPEYANSELVSIVRRRGSDRLSQEC
jgi:hypothetical protein